MAGEEIPETGTPEKIKIEDTVSPVSDNVTPFRPLQVIICDACGKGFLRWIPGGVDTDPLWFVHGAMIGGGICGGALMMISRTAAVEIAVRYEKIGGEKWLKGQRRP
jgi:hypothetical protein